MATAKKLALTKDEIKARKAEIKTKLASLNETHGKYVKDAAAAAKAKAVLEKEFAKASAAADKAIATAQKKADAATAAAEKGRAKLNAELAKLNPAPAETA